MTGNATPGNPGPSAATAQWEEAPQEYVAFRIEQRGIDLIPHAERKMKPSGLFWLWAGAVFNVEFFYYGTLIMFFGLSVLQAVAVIVIGNLLYAFLGFASLQGPQTGTTAFMVTRASFGQNGNRLVALFNWVTQVGFEVEGIFFMVATVILLFSMHGTNLDSTVKIGVIVAAALLQMIVPLLGHATISKIFRFLAYIFIAFFAVLAGFIFDRLHLSTFHSKPATLAICTTAFVLVVSVGGLGWSVNGNDYSRYLPHTTPASKTFWAAALGGAVPSIILELLGVFAYTITQKNFVGVTELGVPESFPSWFVTPFLIFAIFQLLAINTINLYSSGVTLQALGLPAKRWMAVIIDTVVCAVVTGLILFHGTFSKDFAGFLLYIVVWLAPWFGILITDYLLRGRKYHALSLSSSRGMYWRNRGIHWPAVIAQAVGMLATLMWINAATAYPSYIGPISNHFPGLARGDFSWVFGIIVGALLYWVLAGHSIRRERAVTEFP